MKKIYLAFFPALLFLLTACKKDHPVDPFNSKLMSGTWELYKIDAASYLNPPFVNGHFTFKSKGQLEYLDINNKLYKGTWFINQHELTGKHLLGINVFNINGFTLLRQFFDDIIFTDTENFTAYYYVLNQAYSYYFKRI